MLEMLLRAQAPDFNNSLRKQNFVTNARHERSFSRVNATEARHSPNLHAASTPMHPRARFILRAVTTAGPLELENGDYYYLLPKTRLTFPGTQTRTNVEEMFPAIFLGPVPSGEHALADCLYL